MTLEQAEALREELRSAEVARAGVGHLSLTIEVPTLDPLAVLETLDESGARAYLETPARGVAFAAVAPAQERRPEGERRPDGERRFEGERGRDGGMARMNPLFAALDAPDPDFAVVTP